MNKPFICKIDKCFTKIKTNFSSIYRKVNGTSPTNSLSNNNSFAGLNNNVNNSNKDDFSQR